MFFSYRKTILKSWLDTSSIASYLSSFLSFFLSQSRQHLDTWWINQESFWPLDNSSTPGGLIEPYILLLVFLFLDSFSTHDLSRLIFSTPARHLIYRDLLMVYIFFSCDPQLTSVDLSLDASVFSPPKPLSLTPNLFPWDSQAFSSFSSLGKLRISFIYMHFMFWNLRFGVFEKFWGFSKLMSYCWNFGMDFAYMILKLHALHHTCIITIFHAFRCVLYMFNWFYAGRIGLGWAHDAISFACHMFMHFPCIRSPLLNILVILNCFGAFLIVSFFPLSILFTLVVSMVPKRK